MEILYIVMPAYNEQEEIENTIRAWYPIVDKHNGDGKSRLLVFNDGSLDNTFQVASSLTEKFPLLRIVDKKNSGHGPTLIYAYKYAIDRNADYIFQTDSDGQTSPNEFDKFWELKEEYDAIIGNRSIRGDGIDRKLVESVVCFLLKIYFGVSIPDANAPFRLMNKKLLEKYISQLPQNYNLPNIMLTTFFSFNKEKIKFEQISFKPRNSGKNSINFKKIILIGLRALSDFKKFKSEMKKV